MDSTAAKRAAAPSDSKCLRAEARPEPLVVTINYTRPRDGFKRCGAVAGAPGFSLLKSTFTQQHGAVPSDSNSSSLGFEHVPVACAVSDARSMEPQPTLATHGYELLRAADLTPLTPADANEPGSAPLRRHYAEVEAVVAAACGASAARGFCHVRRSADRAVVNGTAGGLYAGYAHTDQAEGSWAALLPSLVAAGEWERQGPPGVPGAFAERAVRARRYAVVTAWRYLGPAATCRASHLALLDPASLRADDFLPFEIAAFGCAGHNYRLRCDAGADGPGADDGSAPPRQSHHAWHYFPGMLPSEELLLLFTYDSAHPHSAGGAGAAPTPPPFAGLPAAAVFHSAFKDPTAAPDELERESIDTRVLCVWDDP